MSDTSILERMIHDDAKIALDEHYDRKKVVLIEHGTTGSSLEIFGVPSDSIVVDIDKNFYNSKLFKNSNGECKRADYMIISEEKQVVIFLEMKKGNPDTASIIKQLKGSLCVFEYCQSIAKEFFSERDFLSSYKKRFVAFKNVNLAKRKTTIDQETGSHTTPENLMKVSWSNSIQFNIIAGLKR